MDLAWHKIAIKVDDFYNGRHNIMTYLYVKTSSAKQYICSIELMAMALIPPFLIKVETATSRDPQSTTECKLW